MIAAAAGVAVLALGVTFERAVRWRRASRVLRRVAHRERRVGESVPRPVPKLVQPPSWIGPMLVDAGVPLATEQVWWTWVASGALAALLGALLGGPILAGGALLTGIGAPPVVLRSLRGRAAARAEADLPGALEEVARGLRSGASLRQAVAGAADTARGILGAELGLVATAAGQGVPLVAALEDWARRSSRSGVRLAVAALSLGAETGGAQARAVDGVAATLRDRLAVAAEVRALTSQTRASMLVIALSPLVFCAFASATDHRTSTFLFRTPFGVACLAGGIALDVAGAAWMRRLSRVPS